MIKKSFAVIVSFLLTLCVATTVSAQSGNTVSVILKDSSTGGFVGYATVSMTPAGSKTATKYILSDEKGKAVIQGVKKGKYSLKIEILGYKTVTKDLDVNASVDLGTVDLQVDKSTLKAAKVSAAGNSIIIKKDTIEYNASSFKTTDNDMLEDLLKKLPGVEVSDDGSVTVNGKSISKITIDGKTFFLDDPQLASKNIPAKIVDKVKVVEKKSDQAEFTGIDDGQEETVIDLSIQKGMMNGLFGNVMAGGGHDIPNSGYYTDDNSWKDEGWRYQGASFIGKFTDKNQLSVIFNANNTNNRGFDDLAGSMMQGMRGGGGGMGQRHGGFATGNGITTSWMGGVNGSWDLFDDKMDLAANYLYSGSKNAVKEDSRKTTYLDDGSNLIYDNNGYSTTNSYGNRLGMRLEHKFSENTSIIFQPQFSFGNGNFNEFSDFSTLKSKDGAASADTTNVGFNNNTGSNTNWKTNGFFLFRQRLGIPGRTLSLDMQYSLSNNDMDGFNQSITSTFDSGAQTDSLVNQRYDQNQKARSLSSRLTYTEPLGNHFYVEANYELSWSKSTSYKDTYDAGNIPSEFDSSYHPYVADGETYNATYSNNILNRAINQRIGADFMYQSDKLRAQVGFGANPTYTHNETTKSGVLQTYDSHVVNWAPQAMIWYDINDNTNLRLFYFGKSSQPSTSQLMPVPDNTNPLNVSFGNPYLEPYFTHNIRGGYRFSNKKTFTTLSMNFSGGFVQSPIVSAIWYGTNGAQYSIPVNGPTSGNASLRMFLNSPIARSNFSVSNMANASYTQSTSYLGSSAFNTDKYYTAGDFDYDSFHNDFPDLDHTSLFTKNKIQSLSATERLRMTYRNDMVELRAGGRTRISKSWYTVSKVSTNMTWNNQLSASMNWTINGGIGLVSDLDYNWYNGYSTKQDDEFILNAEITKLLFKNVVTLSIKAYDILNQAKNLSVTDASNYHLETRNNTLGRYAMLSLTVRFGNFSNASKGMRRGGPGGHGHRGPIPMMM
ncbi:MAG: TonB-dependent receptor family protein [Bacteroidales bacterium]|nr:TonB-dependent receptor family protein [Bacteroidales bacterium]MCI1785489.1 TonB-dependent receptor family protein [Bacteroidales bacterium]